MLEESDVTRGKWMRMVAALAVIVMGSGAQAAELNTLRDLKVVQTPMGAQVVVAGTRAPTFTVFRLSGPERLVVDLSSADATGIKGHHYGTGTGGRRRRLPVLRRAGQRGPPARGPASVRPV